MSKDGQNIPFMNLSAQYETIKDDIKKAIDDVFAANAFIQGPFVAAFEKDFARYCGSDHCVAVGNGTDSLFIALKALGIGPGDEVLVPAMTFVATSEAVTMTGATPIFVDITPTTYTIAPHLIEEKITQRTRAIIPVHLYGHPADMKQIRIIADKYSLKIVQDMAQAHGATIDETPLVEFGDCLSFSFYPGKNLGAYGDAGGLVTNNAQLAEQMRMLANHGRKHKYDHELEGVNSRMDGIQGAVLSVKLKHLDSWTQRRRQWAEVYDNALHGIEGITPPTSAKRCHHVYHLYVIRSDDREGLRRYLSENGVATGVHYPIAPPFLGAYSQRKHTPEEFPNAFALQNQALSLPFFPELGKKRALFVAKIIKDYTEIKTQ